MRAEHATGWGRCWLVAFALALGMLAATTSAHADTYPEAVLLVSGFDTASPFSTPDPSCDGKEGPEWSPAGGIAPTLKPAGLDVFTAPVRQTGEPLLAPCTGAGEAAPPDTAVIDSNGELDDNGKALANLIACMRALSCSGAPRCQATSRYCGGDRSRPSSPSRSTRRVCGWRRLGCWSRSDRAPSSAGPETRSPRGGR